MQKELVANNLILKRILSKVEVLESNLSNTNVYSTTVHQYLDSNFLLMFPINNKEQFTSIKNTIKTEQDFVLKLVTLTILKHFLNFFVIVIVLCIIHFK